MIQFRFEIEDAPHDKNKKILRVFSLRGDFSTGEINNVSTLFDDDSNLAALLNTAVSELMKGMEKNSITSALNFK